MLSQLCYIPLSDDEHRFVQKVHPARANDHWECGRNSNPVATLLHATVVLYTIQTFAVTFCNLKCCLTCLMFVRIKANLTHWKIGIGTQYTQAIEPINIIEHVFPIYYAQYMVSINKSQCLMVLLALYCHCII